MAYLIVAEESCYLRLLYPEKQKGHSKVEFAPYQNSVFMFKYFRGKLRYGLKDLKI